MCIRDSPEVEADSVAVQGSGAEYLEKLSATAQLVVVGGGGADQKAAAPLGSIGHAMIYHAECPVLVVRGRS